MNYTHPTYEIMTKLLTSEIAVKKKISILDYGCGSGYLLSILPKVAVKKYCGYETSKSAIDVAKKQFRKQHIASFIYVDTSQKLRLPNRNMDVVIAIGVLQYMSKSQILELISECSKVLKKGGVVLISCVSDHLLYKMINLYGLVIKNSFVNRKWLLECLKKYGFKVKYSQEKGLLFGPLFYHNIVLIFDILDKLLYRTKGTLGPFGKSSRKVAAKIASLENKIPINLGYTLYLKATKS